MPLFTPYQSLPLARRIIQFVLVLIFLILAGIIEVQSRKLAAKPIKAQLLQAPPNISVSLRGHIIPDLLWVGEAHDLEVGNNSQLELTSCTWDVDGREIDSIAPFALAPNTRMGFYRSHDGGNWIGMLFLTREGSHKTHTLTLHCKEGVFTWKLSAE